MNYFGLKCPTTNDFNNECVHIITHCDKCFSNVLLIQTLVGQYNSISTTTGNHELNVTRKFFAL